MSWWGGTSSGGVPGTGWAGEVDTYGDLPEATGSGDVYLVKTSTGYLFWKNQAGLYIDSAVGTWLYVGKQSLQVLDNDLEFIDNDDNTKVGELQLSGITTGNTRTLNWPDADGTIALTSDLDNPEKTYIISPSGGDYTTIQAALTANSTGGELFIVYPGTYTNDTINFTANSQTVATIGKGNNVIVTNSSQVVEAGDFTGCKIKNIRINFTPTTAVNGIEINNGSMSMDNCKLDLTTSSNIAGTTQPALLAVTGTGTLTTKFGEFTYQHTGNTTSGVKAMFNIATGGTLSCLRLCESSITNSGTATATVIAIDVGSAVLNLRAACELIVTDTDSSIVAGLGYVSGSGSNEFDYCKIAVVGGGSNACYGIYNAGTGNVRSIHNIIKVTGGATNNSFFTGASATTVSIMDDIRAANGIAGTGSYTCVNSPADGDFCLDNATLSKIIAATSSTTGLQITAADGVTPLMNVDTANGRLGFGTITPAKQIDITKDIQLVNTTAADEGVIYKGSYAFFHNFSHPTGGSAKPTGRNLFVGPRAGNFTMGSAATSTDHASFNLAIGDQALLSNQLGYHNTAIGYLASALNQDGAFNISIGAYALYANVDTDGNVGIGYSSGRSVTAGIDSIFIGSNAGFNASQKTNPDNVLCLGSGTYCTEDDTYMYGNTDVLKHIFQSGIVGMSTTSPISSLGGLDIASGGLSLILGADQTTQTIRTDDTAKYCRIGLAHYTNAEEPVCLISAGSGITTGTKNFVHIGGGTSLMNAINEFRVYTSDAIDTTTGTLRMEIDSTGTRTYNYRVIKQVFSVSGIEDNTATTIFTITTPITGTQGDGAGSYSCYIRGLATYPMSGSPQTNKPYHCLFSRSNANAAGNPGTNSAVQVLLDGAAVTTGAGRSIDSITISLLETDEQNLAVQATIDLTTASSTTSYFFGEIEIIWNGYLEAPIIS